MQPALRGVRHSRRSIPKLCDPRWLQNILEHGMSLQRFEKKRCASSATLAASPPPPRRRAGTGSEEATADEDLSFAEVLRRGIAQSVARRESRSAEAASSVTAPYRPDSAQYGKWQALSQDGASLLREVTADASEPQHARLIDQPGNENDMELWSCLLHFAHRRMGRDGVLMVWQSLSVRRSLYQLEGSLAQSFWGTILDAAVSSDAVLRDVTAYAEWMYETHQVRWPQLYSTVMSYMLGTGSRSQVLRWHVTLAPSFGPDEAGFVELMKEFITSPNPYTQGKPNQTGTLQTLYIYSPHRNLYDTLIPYLYSKGYAFLARHWRKILVDVKDTPTSLSARPFLRFMRAYYPLIPLREDELKVAGLERIGAGHAEPPSLPEKAITGQDLSYLINRVHGETFGIQEKRYNDKLGAKWLASSWVSVDFAISTLYTIGVQEIGPLSLQSIALREGNARGVLRRIDQLQQLQIKLPSSNYAKAIQYHARVGNDEALLRLLQTDIHPDVFDDEAAQHDVLSGCVRVGDWRTYELVLATRLAVLSNSIATSSDSLIESCVHQGNGRLVLTILREMSSRGLDISPTTSHLVSSFILEHLSPHADNTNSRELVDLHISLCRQLAASRFPPAVEVWRTLLFRLGRECRLLELERLSLYIAQLFIDHTTSEQPMWICHAADVPMIFRAETPFPNFQKLPRDLPLRHLEHPLRLIFDAKLLTSIVRWGFSHTRYDEKAEAAVAPLIRAFAETNGSNGGANDRRERTSPRLPADFHFARGLRLAAMLLERGVVVTVKSVRKEVLLRLTDLYRGGGRSAHEWPSGNWKWKMVRRRNRLSLAEAKLLCDEAWGVPDEAVPTLLELNRHIELTDQDDNGEAMRRRLFPENAGKHRAR